MGRVVPRGPGQGTGIFRSRVARRITFLFVLSSLVPLSGLAFLTLQHLQDELLRQAERSLRETCKSTGMAIAERLHLLDMEARLVGSRVSRIRPRAGPLSLLADDRKHFTGFYWDPPDLSHAEPSLLPTLTPRQRDHLASGRALLVTTPGPSRRARIQLVLRVETAPDDGALLWGEIDPSYLLGGESRAPPASLAVLLDRDGQVLWPAAPDRTVAQIARLALPTGANPRLRWRSEGLDHLGTRWSLFLEPGFSTSWVVVTGRPESEILAPLRGFRTLFLLVAALTFLVICLVVIVQVRRNLTPLAQLIRATHDLAERRLGTRVSIATGDEFEELGHSFNRMAGDLAEYIRQMGEATQASAAMTVQTEIGDLLRTVLHGARALTGADGSAIYESNGQGDPRLQLLHIESRDLTVDPAKGDFGNFTEHALRPPAYHLLRETIGRHETLRIPDLGTHTGGSDPGPLAERLGYQVHAVMVTPLCDKHGDTTGFLQLFNRRDKGGTFSAPFTDLDVHAVEALASQAVVAMGRNRLTDELSASEARYRGLVDNSPGPIFIHDGQGRLEYVNPAWARTLGHKAEEACGRSLGEFLPRTGEGSIEAYLGSMGEPDGASGVLRPRTRDGETRVWAFRNARLEGGPSSGSILVHAQDITERDRLESNLRQAQKMQAMGTLAGGIAHDFNNLLTPIMAYTELSVDRLPEGDRIRTHLEKVLAASHRAKDLVKQILAFSRRDDPGRQVMEIHPLAKEVVKLLDGSVSSDIEVRAEIDTRSGPVLADPTQMHQVLLNLCTNAAHAMTDGGGILLVRLDPVEAEAAAAILALKAQPYVRLTVRDTGCGMPPELQARVFEPFFTTREAGDGTGMGLATVHGIVSAMGGEIVLKSRAGDGTTFEVYFPRIRGEATPARGSSERVVGHRERILFVDDQLEIAELGGEMLNSRGYDPVVRTSGDSALDTFQENPGRFDLVITDQQMPGMTGAALLRKLRRIRSDIPVILLTGYSKDYDEKRALATGFDAFCSKPLSARGLSEVVRNVLNTRCEPPSRGPESRA